MTVEKQLADLIAEVKKLTKSSEEQDKKLEGLSTKLDTNKQEISKLIEENFGSLVDRVDVLEKTVEKVDVRMDENADILTRVCNLLLTGLPFKENENVGNIVKILSHKLGYEDPPEMMHYRFKSNDIHRPILIRFPTEYHKIQFLQRYYKVAKDLTCGIFDGFRGNKNRIYIQHDFTPSQYKLHKFAMILKKDGKVAEVKVNLGNIIVVKINERDKFKSFKSYEDLQKATATQAD